MAVTRHFRAAGVFTFLLVCLVNRSAASQGEQLSSFIGRFLTSQQTAKVNRSAPFVEQIKESLKGKELSPFQRRFLPLHKNRRVTDPAPALERLMKPLEGRQSTPSSSVGQSLAWLYSKVKAGDYLPSVEEVVKLVGGANLVSALKLQPVDGLEDFLDYIRLEEIMSNPVAYITAMVHLILAAPWYVLAHLTSEGITLLITLWNIITSNLIKGGLLTTQQPTVGHSLN